MRLLFCFSFVLLATTASAQWSIASQSKPLPLGHGAWQVEKSVTGPSDADLNLVFFDSSRCRLEICDQPLRENTSSLADTMTQRGALAGCNGGYFTPEFQPLGLLVAQGKRVGAFQKSSLLGGLLMVRKGKPMMLWRDEYVSQSGITELIQAGPRLVNGGGPVTGLEALRRRARTFILTDNDGHWAIGTCRSVTLRELSDLLATKGIINELEVERALNLDGGSSTGLWWKDATGAEHYEREYATVRNFIAVVPKS
jgi:uncharacterized protein YigE (DUF2233 family)